MSYTKNDTLAISLCGKWGTGKTSILNMVIEEIGNLSNDRDEDEKPIIIKFNPWNYSDCSQLISQFFVAIQAQLKVDSGKKGLKEFSVLNHSVKEIAIAFYLWCRSENCDYHDINKEEVNSVIPQWETND